MKIGTTNISKIFLGTSEVKKVYNGTSLVYSASARTPYYTEGTENVDWINGSPVVNFNASYMGVTTLTSTAIVDAYAVTNSTVNLTNINTIYIDLSSSRSASVPKLTGVTICISSTKLGAHTTYNAYTTASKALSRQILSVDVSGLSGSYYIRIHAHKGGSTSSSYYAVNVYNVWGE